MRKKLFTIAAISSSITMWILAGLWHEVIMSQFYSEEAHATHEGTGIIFIAYLVLGIIMTYFYSPNRTEKRSYITGLKFGAIMGILWIFPHELAMAGAHGTSILYVFKNALWHIVEQGAGGIVIAVILKRAE